MRRGGVTGPGIYYRRIVGNGFDILTLSVSIVYPLLLFGTPPAIRWGPAGVRQVRTLARRRR